MKSLYPRRGTCANCGRKARDLFYHVQDQKLYCTDVFPCEARFEAAADRYWRKRAKLAARRV